MAIEKIFVNNDMETLRSVLDGFNGMTAALNGSILTLSDADENVLCTIEKLTSGSNAYNQAYRFIVYANNSLSQTISFSTNPSLHNLSYAWKCSGGIMLDIEIYLNNNYWRYPCYITKTNLGKTAFILPNQPNEQNNAQFYTQLWCIAWGDVGTLRTYSFSPAGRNQAIIVPLPTNNAFGTPSYTQDAGFLPFNISYSAAYGSMILNGETYLTNSYFAIRDSKEAS